MKNKVFSILKHRASYNYLCVVCVLMILLYTIQKNFLIEPSIMAIIWLISMVCILIGAIAIIYLILRDDSKNEFKQRMVLCRNCATDISKYQFANFDFLTFEELIEIEASLKNDSSPNNCFVYIYTSNVSKKEKSKETVKENVASGVNYRVFYIDGTPTQGQKELYGEDHLIACTASEVDRFTDFDIMLFVDSSRNSKGYFCVNFSTPQGPRPCSQGYHCENECHYQNENLLYKKIRDDTVEILLRTLREKEEKNEK